MGYSGNSPKHKVQGRLLLDVVVAEGAAILKLLAGEDQALLVRGDTSARTSVTFALARYNGG